MHDFSLIHNHSEEKPGKGIESIESIILKK